MLHCSRCGHAQLDTVVAPSAIYGRYLYTTRSSPGLAAYFVSVAEMLRSLVPLTAQDLVIDIGSNDGSLLKALQPYVRVVGVDPAEHIAQRATDEGVPTVAGWWTTETAHQLVAAHGQAALITATNVLANVDDLRAFMAALQIALAPQGVVMIETGYCPDIVRELLIDTIEHEHLSYFSLRSLRVLAAQGGFRVLRAEHTESKGGSIRVYLQRDTIGPKDYACWPQDDRALEYGETELETRTFQARASARCADLHDFVEDAAMAGRRVYAYGASVGGTTLLYAAGLNMLVRAVLDDNPIRHGLVTPGAHLPVRSSAQIDDADDVVVLAWRYLDRIRAQHPRWMGRFIVPLPTLRTVTNRL